MTPSPRRIALVCMTPATDTNELPNVRLPSYGIRRILAALVADPELQDAKIALIDAERDDVDAYVEAIESFEPDLIGMSVYVWSTPCLVEVARRVKRRRPDCTIVFGGPSARKAVFDLPPYAGTHAYLDAVVSSEGEVTFREIAHLPRLSRAALRTVGGLDLPAAEGWVSTGPRTPLGRLDDIASPFQLGIMPGESIAYLETYRGCPFSCTFCEWGASDASKAVFSTEYLVRELDAFGRHGSPAMFLLDAGLNLNAKGFRNLRDAEAQVGYLRSAGFWCELYPSHLKDEHLEFLSRTRASYLGVGLQSLDPEVLKGLERHYERERFEAVVPQLCRVANVEIQIIFGLPGDSPEGFRRTLAFARSFPATVRAYHCLVLPDALMTRGRPEWNIGFDPVTLAMISCAGWSADQLRETRAYVTEEARAAGGSSGDYWFHFPRQETASRGRQPPEGSCSGG